MTLNDTTQTDTMPTHDQFEETSMARKTKPANGAAADEAPKHDAPRAEAATYEQTAQSTETDPLQAPPNRDTAFGQAVWLMMNTPQFKHTFLADLEWMIVPPILLGQYRMFYAEGRAVGFAAWAYVSDEVKERLESSNPRLAPAEWKSGDTIVLAELFTPFGGQEKILEELKKGPLEKMAIKFSHTAQNAQQISGGASQDIAQQLLQKAMLQ